MYEDISQNSNKKERGFEFEKLINKICDDKEILILKSYKTADSEQQIDGAIEINNKIFLIEAKWEDTATLAASKLFSFLGKINSKIEGTLGIFISHNELSENFISSVRNGLRQNCILIHGEDNIKDIVDQTVDIKEFIWYIFQQASTKNRSFVKTSEFISMPQNKPALGTIIGQNWNEISKYLINSSSLVEFSSKLEEYYNPSIELSKKTLNLFSVVQTDKLTQGKYYLLITKCIKEEVSDFQLILLQLLKNKHWREYAEYDFLEYVKEYVSSIDDTDKDAILKNAVEHIEINESNFNEENLASTLVSFLINQLNETDFKMLANTYLSIYCDDCRKEKFLQKQIANYIFNKLNNDGVDILRIVEPTLKKQIKRTKRFENIFADEGETDQMKKENTINSINYRFRKILKGQDKNYLDNLYNTL